MLNIVVAALCSVLVSVLLKLARRFDVDVGQAVAWNYVATTALTLAVLQPALPPLQQVDTPRRLYDNPATPWAMAVPMTSW